MSLNRATLAAFAAVAIAGGGVGAGLTLLFAERGSHVVAPEQTVATPARTVIAVPDLVGLRYGEARRSARAAGFRVSLVFTKSSDRRAGTVVAQHPVAASATAAGASLKLVVVRRPR